MNTGNMRTIATVILSEYDSEWVRLFLEEKQRLIDVLGDGVVVEHIGSTAIPGSVAKPEIDIMIGIKKLSDARKFIEPLQEVGYVYFPKFETYVPERRYFRKSEGNIPLYHIHMVELKSDFWREHILFRDYLKNHPKVVKEYNEFKRVLVDRFGGDRKKYGEEKSKFISKILKGIM